MITGSNRTKLAYITGAASDGFTIERRRVAVRFTSDKSGETLSLALESAGIMIIVPFEEVEKLIRRARG